MCFRATCGAHVITACNFSHALQAHPTIRRRAQVVFAHIGEAYTTLQQQQQQQQLHAVEAQDVGSSDYSSSGSGDSSGSKEGSCSGNGSVNNDRGQTCATDAIRSCCEDAALI